MSKITQSMPEDYAVLLVEVKERVRSAQYEALKAVNKELIALHWDKEYFCFVESNSQLTQARAISSCRA